MSVPVNTGLAALSDHLVVAAVLVYALAMLAYAAESAAARGSGSRPPVRRAAEAPAPALVGAGGGGSDPSYDAIPLDEPPVPSGAGSRVGRLAVALTVLAWALHLGSLVARGGAEHRVPWGNMYEFSSAGAFAAATAFLVLLTRQRARYLGVLVMLSVVLTLGLAGTVLYTQAGPLVPALHSYWLEIHVTAAIISSGILTVGSAAAALYLLSLRYDARVAAGKSVGMSGLARRLPSQERLDRTAYRAIAFAFPIWTFAIIAGAIWAESAWGRYWGWDPKETWAFITWVIYAGYLHARSTAGWRGRKAAWIALLGMAAFLFNYFGVNTFIVGLHSYAGI